MRSKLWKKITKNSSIKNIIKNSSLLTLANVFVSLFGIVSLSLTVRTLGAWDFWKIALIQSYVLIVDAIFNFQSWQAIIKFWPKYLKDKKQQMKGIIKSGVTLDVLSALIAFCAWVVWVYIGGYWFGRDAELMSLMLIYCFVILFNLSGSSLGVLRLCNNFNYIAIKQIIVSTIKLLAVVFGFIMKEDLSFFLRIWAICDILGYILLFVFSQIAWVKNGLKYRRKAKYYMWKKIFTFTFWTNISSTADLPVKQWDIFLVSYFLSLEAVGIYKTFKQLLWILTHISDPIYQSIYPEFSKQITNNKAKWAIFICKKYAKYMWLWSLIIFILTLFIIQPLLSTIFSPIIAQSREIFILFLGVHIINVVCIPIHPLYVALWFVKQEFIIILLTNVLYIFLAWAFITNIGLSWIIIAYGIQVSLVVIVKIIHIRKLLHSKHI